MPCRDGRDERGYEDTSKIDSLTQILCEVCRELDKRGLMTEMSGETQKWYANHKKEDARQAKLRREVVYKAQLRKAALKKLTAEEKKALNLI